MGGCNSTEQDQNSKTIDKELAKSRKATKKEMKILLLV